MQFTKLIAVGLSVFLIALAAERFDEKIRNDFFAGLMGNREALARAMAACEKVLEENPRHAEALVWHGAGLFSQGGEAFSSGDPDKGRSLAARGMKEMDEAVALEPDNIGVRIPRGASLMQASHFISNPEMSKSLRTKGRSDYEHVHELQRARLDKIGEHPKGELLFGIAEASSRLGDIEKAAAFFDRIAREMPGTPYAKRAAKWMETKSLGAADAGCIGCHVK